MPSPQETVNASSKTLEHCDTKVKIAGVASLATGYFLPRPLRLIHTAASGALVFFAAKRYHALKQHQQTVSDARAQSWQKIEDTYPGFFSMPNKAQVDNAGGEMQTDLQEVVDMAEDTYNRFTGNKK